MIRYDLSSTIWGLPDRDNGFRASHNKYIIMNMKKTKIQWFGVNNKNENVTSTIYICIWFNI